MSLEVLLVPLAIAIVVKSVDVYSRAGSHQYSVPTKARDPELLQKALVALGGQPELFADGMMSQFDEFGIVFEQDEQGTFHAIASERLPQDRALEFVEQVDAQYAIEVQASVYQKVLERAEREGLVLESEQVDDDNSVVLTFLTNRENG